MKIFSIFGRYIFTEMIPPFVINTAFFTFIFLLTQILDITNMIVNYKVGLWVILQMIVYSLPYFLVFVIPMSIMMSVLLSFLRMSGDNEIVAMKAGGVSIYQMLPPVIIFCLAGCIITALTGIYAIPWSRTGLKNLVIEVAASRIDIGLKERTFNDSFDGVMLYVNSIDIKNHELIDIFIEDRRQEKIVITIIAPKGRLISEAGRAAFHLWLKDGLINQVDLENRRVNSIRFDTYEINLDLQKSAEAEKEHKSPKDMDISELSRHIKKQHSDYSAQLIFHKKFSIPFACIALGILAVPLGIQNISAKRSYGLGMGLVSFLLYYLMLSAGQVFGERGILPPIIGMWIPNIIFAGIGVYLVIRTGNDKPLKIEMILDFIRGIIKNIGR